jgi:hypothetical protein
MMQQPNTSQGSELAPEKRLVIQSSPQAAVSCNKSQIIHRKSQVLPFKFVKAAWPSHRHSRKPARFEFTRNVRRHADTVFGHVFCRTR